MRTTPLKKWQWALAIYVIGSLLAGPFISHLHKSLRSQRGDWLSIYNIALHSVQTGELQAKNTDDLVITQRYPPIARPILMLFALPPKPVSAVLSFVLFAGLYGWCSLRLSELFLQPSKTGRWVGAGIGLVLVGPYIWADLTAGNLTSILLWSVTASFMAARRGQGLRAGIALSVGILLKMIPAVCLLYFIMRRRWRVAWGAFIGVLALGVLPSLAIFGPQKMWDYHGYWYREEFKKFTPLATIDEPVECLYQNQAVVRTMVRLFTPTNAGHSNDPFFVQIAEPPRWMLKAAYIAIMGASVVLLVWLVWRARRDETVIGAGGSYALCVGVMLWLSPWVASYYFSLAIWPLMALASQIFLPRRADDGDSHPSNREPSANGENLRLGAILLWVLLMPALGSQFLRALGLTMWAAMIVLIVTATTVARAPNKSTS